MRESPENTPSSELIVLAAFRRVEWLKNLLLISIRNAPARKLRGEVRRSVQTVDSGSAQVFPVRNEARFEAPTAPRIE